MHLSHSISKRRMAVIINYGFILLTLLLGLAGHSIGWSDLTITGFWISVVMVLITFYPLHIKTGLWRLVHTSYDRMDEREIQQTLGALRHAYIVFSIVTLLIILAAVFLGTVSQSLQLIAFWILLYLAHTLPSSILAWTANQTPTQSEEK